MCYHTVCLICYLDNFTSLFRKKKEADKEKSPQAALNQILCEGSQLGFNLISVAELLLAGLGMQAT